MNATCLKNNTQIKLTLSVDKVKFNQDFNKSNTNVSLVKFIPTAAVIDELLSIVHAVYVQHATEMAIRFIALLCGKHGVFKTGLRQTGFTSPIQKSEKI